jgi:putative transposase
MDGPKLREAFPWDAAPRYLLHDRDYAIDRLAVTADAMGIEEVLTAPRDPWQNRIFGRQVPLEAETPMGSHRVASGDC